MNKLDILERVLIASRRQAHVSPVSRRLYAMCETMLDLGGMRALLKKGARIIYPAVFHDNTINVILTGNALFEVDHGYRLAMAHSSVVITATDAAFYVARRDDQLELVVHRNQVFVSVNGSKVMIGAHQSWRCNVT